MTPVATDVTEEAATPIEINLMGTSARIPIIPPRLTLFEHLYFSASQLVEVFLEVMACRLTGKLTINFSQGVPAGEVEWTQKRKVDPTAT